VFQRLKQGLESRAAKRDERSAGALPGDSITVTELLDQSIDSRCTGDGICGAGASSSEESEGVLHAIRARRRSRHRRRAEAIIVRQPRRANTVGTPWLDMSLPERVKKPPPQPRDTVDGANLRC